MDSLRFSVKGGNNFGREDGRWKMEDGRWKMEDGRWKMEDGRWKMEDGRWKTKGARIPDFESLHLCTFVPL